MRKYTLLNSLTSLESLELKLSPTSLAVVVAAPQAPSVATQAGQADDDDDDDDDDDGNGDGDNDDDPLPNPEPAPGPDPGDNPPIVYPILPPAGPSGPGS